MKVIISPRAEKQFKKIPKTDQIAIVRKIRSLKKDKKISQKEKLTGYQSIYRVRIGFYRIVYKKTKSLLYIVLIGHRKDIYRLLKQLLK
ncbi:type II toxin-antitoxin system RelE/ParE family toxin [Patescibacteria group bacterium]